MSSHDLAPEDLTGSAAHELSSEIRRRRKLAGLSHAQLATQIGYSRQYVSIAERPGKGLASRGLVDAIDEALQAGGILTNLHGRASAERRARRRTPMKAKKNHASHVEQRPASVSVQHSGPGMGGDAESQYTALTTMLRFADHPAAMISSDSMPQLDELIVHLQEQWHLLVRADNMLGPRHALAGVMVQQGVIEELLVSTRLGDRSKVLRLAAQYAESASWLHEDGGNLEAARYWCDRALEWAVEADDPLMMSWTLFRRSQQALTSRNAAQVLSLTQAANRVATEPTAPMRAAFAQQEAHGQALDGDEIAAMRKLDDAHTWASADSAGDARDGHGSFCTPSYIEVQRAGCLLTLGRAKSSIRLYETALPKLPSVYRRDRGVALSRLATAYASIAEPEQAAHVATEALHIARAAGSIRTLQEIRTVGQQLDGHRGLPPVARLMDELARR